MSVVGRVDALGLVLALCTCAVVSVVRCGGAVVSAASCGLSLSPRCSRRDLSCGLGPRVRCLGSVGCTAWFCREVNADKPFFSWGRPIIRTPVRGVDKMFHVYQPH